MLQKLPKRLATEQRDPVIAVEDLEEAVRELPSLLVRYWKENGDSELPIDPDWQALFRAQALKQLVLVTVRHEGDLVGFAVNLFYFHPTHRTVPHCQTLWIWLDPIYRVGSFGLKFIKKNLEFINIKFESLPGYSGPTRAFIATPDEGVGKIYERAGYAFCEAVYERVG